MPPAKRPNQSTVVSFKSKKPKIQGFEAFGRDWKVKPANVTYLVNFEEEENLAPLYKFIIAHVVKDQREDFVEAMSDDEDLDLENLIELASKVQQAAYPNLPTNPS